MEKQKKNDLKNSIFLISSIGFSRQILASLDESMEIFRTKLQKSWGGDRFGSVDIKTFENSGLVVKIHASPVKN